MTSKNTLTFRQILETTRIDAAQAAWTRAKLVSRLRHGMADRGRGRTVRRLGQLKLDAIRHALSLVPERIKVTIDDDYQVGLISVRWPGHGNLHLPASSALG